MREVSDKKDICIAHIPTRKEMVDYFGTEKPNRKQVEDRLKDYDVYLADLVGVRGIGYCITVYKDEVAAELLFGGWSFD